MLHARLVARLGRRRRRSVVARFDVEELPARHGDVAHVGIASRAEGHDVRARLDVDGEPRDARWRAIDARDHRSMDGGSHADASLRGGDRVATIARDLLLTSDVRLERLTLAAPLRDFVEIALVVIRGFDPIAELVVGARQIESEAIAPVAPELAVDRFPDDDGVGERARVVLVHALAKALTKRVERARRRWRGRRDGHVGRIGAGGRRHRQPEHDERCC